MTIKCYVDLFCHPSKSNVKLLDRGILSQPGKQLKKYRQKFHHHPLREGCTLHIGWIYRGWRDLTGRENENTKSMGNHKNITTSAAYLRQSRKEKTMLFQKIPPEIHAFWRVQASLTRFTISPPFSVSSLQLRSILVTVVLHKCGVKIVKLVALKWGYPYSWHVG